MPVLVVSDNGNRIEIVAKRLGLYLRLVGSNESVEIPLIDRGTVMLLGKKLGIGYLVDRLFSVAEESR